jgi:transposase InsO family protein
MESVAQMRSEDRILAEAGRHRAEPEHGVSHLEQASEAAAQAQPNRQRAARSKGNSSARHEEFGRTPFKAGDLGLAQQRADAYLDYYHTRRPHMALNMLIPAQFVVESHLR